MIARKRTRETRPPGPERTMPRFMQRTQRKALPARIRRAGRVFRVGFGTMSRMGMRTIADALMLGTALFQAGCAGTPVRFVEPPGARVRIDEGPRETIPFERSVSLGIHRVEIQAPPGWKAAGEEGAALSVRGVLLVLESPGEKAPEIRIGESDLRWSLRGGAVQCSWADDDGREMGILKATAGGVPPDDPDVRGAQSRWEEGKAAAEAALQARAAQADAASREESEARALRREQARDEGRAARHHRNMETAGKIVAAAIIVFVVGVVVLLIYLSHHPITTFSMN